jgi:hypothetical protein
MFRFQLHRSYPVKVHHSKQTQIMTKSGPQNNYVNPAVNLIFDLHLRYMYTAQSYDKCLLISQSHVHFEHFFLSYRKNLL